MFDVHQTIFNEDGDSDDHLVGEYIDGLLEEFEKSPEAKAQAGHDEFGYPALMMEYAVNYVGVSPAAMTVDDFNEVVFELFPRKLSTDPGNAPLIVDALRAFWSFIARQYNLENARQILTTLDDKAAERLRKGLADPANYGMAKSFFMMGNKAGFDMSSPEGLAQFQALYNQSLTGLPLPLPGETRADGLNLLPLGSIPDRPMGKALKAKRQDRKRERQAKKKNRKK